VDAYIALGSNQGDRELNLLRAVAEIGKIPHGKVTGLSSFYETSPVGVVDQPAFCNAVLRFSTALSPRDLLQRLLLIETEVFKRQRTRHWGPRSVDLDLLLHGQTVLHEEGLELPHPRMTERRFVLQPLCDIAPEVRHPVSGLTMAELLAGLVSDERVVKL